MFLHSQGEQEANKGGGGYAGVAVGRGPGGKASSPVVTQAVVIHDGPKWHLPSAMLTLGLAGYLEATAG